MIYYQDDEVTILHEDCRDALALSDDNSVDSIVTDPPYNLSFMGKRWDATGIAFSVDMWAECLRVLKPGGHLVAFGGTRTWHRLACAIEDAGFEIRDNLAWLYGSGFPKSMDVSKALDKAAGAKREVMSTGIAVKRMIPGADQNATGSWIKDNGRVFVPTKTAPATDAARQWEGWGTALKPAFEPIILARKPLIGTVAANVLKHGTGGLHIDACRVAASHSLVRPSVPRADNTVFGKGLGAGAQDEPAGRWPPNVALDSEAARELDEQSGTLKAGGSITAGSKGSGPRGNEVYGVDSSDRGEWGSYGDSGGASRFFPVFKYQAKAPTKERPSYIHNDTKIAHPTVKPLGLMRWLVKMITPPDGLVLDPFAGSGATIEACLLEGFRSTAIEKEADYLPLIMQRLERSEQVA